MAKLQENLWIHRTYEDFSKGAHAGTRLLKSNKIILDKKEEKYRDTGLYVSAIIPTDSFHQLILSWNADTPEGTSVEIEAQVLIRRGWRTIWSDWLSFGSWSSHGPRSSFKKTVCSNSCAYIDTDTIRLSSVIDESAESVRYRLTLTSSDTSKTPSVRLVAGTMRSLSPESTNDALTSNANTSTVNKILNVPCYSQMLRNPEIANVICSPTSMAMVLNYHGINITPEEVAEHVYDKLYDGYGNWPFNTAFAGSLGFEAYVCSCGSANDLKKEIYNGYPAVVSVKYRCSEGIEADLPVVHGAPIAKTNGHLIVVAGFVSESGKDYVVVNDPAASSDESVRLKYLLSEFEEAWHASGRTAYIIHP